MSDERSPIDAALLEAIGQEAQAKEAQAKEALAKEAHPEAPAPSEAARLLQAEIAITRQRVASEVDAIAERIKPENIKRRVVLSLQDRAVAALDLARRNPVPVALAVGASLLLMIWRARARHA